MGARKKDPTGGYVKHCLTSTGTRGEELKEHRRKNHSEANPAALVQLWSVLMENNEPQGCE